MARKPHRKPTLIGLSGKDSLISGTATGLAIPGLDGATPGYASNIPPAAANQVNLVHEGLGVLLTLPFWPNEISRDLKVRTWTELERPSRRPLTIPGGLTNDTHSLGFTLRDSSGDDSINIQDKLDLLEAIAEDTRPFKLLIAGDSRGMFHIESCNVIEVEWAPGGHPSIVDVSLGLKRATDVTINVGLVNRKRNPKPVKSDNNGDAPKDKKSVKYAQYYARTVMKKRYGWGDADYNALVNLWNKESGWNYKATNRSSGAYGIPQSLPASKMSTAGADWRTNPETQIDWGLGYIKERYGNPRQAWQHFQENNFY